MIDQNVPETNTPQNNLPPASASRPKAWIIATVVAVFLLIGTAAGYYFWNAQNSKDLPSNMIKSIDNSTSNTDNNTTPPDTTPSDLAVDSGTPCTTYTPTTHQLSGDIEWIKPDSIIALNIFTNPDNNNSSYIKDNSKFYKVGNVKSGAYAGADVILGTIAVEGPAFYPNFARLLRKDNKIIYLQKYSSELYETDGLDKSKFSVDKNYQIPDLDYPDSFQGQTGRQVFDKDVYATSAFCADQLKIAFHHAVLGDVYTTDIVKLGEGMRGFNGYGFYLAFPDGSTKVYKLRIDFTSATNVPQVTWSDGTANTSEYAYTDVGGCGFTNYIAVVSPSKVNEATDLLEAGKNSFGEKIYMLKDPNHPLLKDIYDNQYNPYEGGKVSYQDYIKARPVFFWHDPFGRLVKFQSNKFMPMAECGKPVIYLYPTSAQKVSVKLSPQGGFSYTEPAYENGWNVWATPSGLLTDLNTGTNYTYLFWEGRGGIYMQEKERGFVVEKANVHQFLQDKLSLLGLNAKESADFMEFWEPRMQAAPYYFVTFYGNAVMDAIAPLEINPKPDTVIRILMDFQPLENPIQSKPYQIRTPARNGFTVVEWGGVIR